jgi:hypothetical protein
MEEGHILYQGTVDELRQRGILEDIKVELIESRPVLSILDEELEPWDDFTSAEKLQEDKEGTEGQNVKGHQDLPKDTMAIPPPDREWLLAQQTREKDRKKPRKLIEEESRETGSVKWKIYDTYLSASYVVSHLLTC